VQILGDSPGHSRWRAALVNRARQLLAASPGSPHRLSDLADTLGISPFYFARVFRAETGISVHQYLLHLRMASAYSQLSRGNADISRLALDLGFSSHSHFTARFRKEFGKSPVQVRSDLATRDSSRA
jgi:AraC family transcriptional regulator